MAKKKMEAETAEIVSAVEEPSVAKKGKRSVKAAVVEKISEKKTTKKAKDPEAEVPVRKMGRRSTRKEAAEEAEEKTVLSGRKVTMKGSAAHKMSDVAFSMSENYARILDLMENKNLCEAIIGGIHKRTEEFPKDCVIVNYLDFPIYIPMEDFLLSDEVERIKRVSESAAMKLPNYNKERFEREEMLKTAQKMIGAKIMFMITNARMEMDESIRNVSNEPLRIYMVTGNRVAAMKVLQHKHFFAPSARRNPVKVGDVVECYVLRTYRDYVIVSCCGVNVTMYRNQLMVTKWCNPLTDFIPGATFDAVVESIEVDAYEETVKMVLTRVPLDVDVAKYYLRQLESHNSRDGMIGTIAYIARDKRYNTPRFYGINLDVYKLRALVPVKSNNYQQMHVNDRVVFHCDRVDNENLLLVGYCEPHNISDRRNW